MPPGPPARDPCRLPPTNAPSTATNLERRKMIAASLLPRLRPLPPPVVRSCMGPGTTTSTSMTPRFSSTLLTHFLMEQVHGLDSPIPPSVRSSMQYEAIVELLDYAGGHDLRVSL